MKLFAFTFFGLLTVSSVFSQAVNLTKIDVATVKNIIDYLLEDRLLELQNDTVNMCTKEIQLASDEVFFNHNQRTFRIVNTPGYIDEYCTFLLYHYRTRYEEERSVKFLVRKAGDYDGTLYLMWDRQQWNVTSDYTIHSVE